MKPIHLASLVFAISLTNGCGLFGNSKKLTEIPATFHIPPQVEAGRPFLVYADFNANCDDKAEVTAAIDDGSKTVNMKLSQWLGEYQACPAAVHMMRMTKTMTLSAPGTYQVVARSFESGQPATSAKQVLVLPSGQPAPEWTPAPLNDGLRVLPTGTLVGRVIDGSTGAGLAAVKVSISFVMPPVETITDPDGHFVLEKAPQGTQFIDVAKDGFALRGDRVSAKVFPNTTVTLDELSLQPISAPTSPSPTPSAN